MRNKVDDPIPTTPEEDQLLQAVKALFSSKSEFSDGAEFRVAFISAAMDGYCDACGSKCEFPCYCTRDD